MAEYELLTMYKLQPPYQNMKLITRHVHPSLQFAPNKWNSVMGIALISDRETVFGEGDIDESYISSNFLHQPSIIHTIRTVNTPHALPLAI